jgi:hypothetical protein
MYKRESCMSRRKIKRYGRLSQALWGEPDREVL